LGRVEAVALHDADDREGVLESDSLVAIFRIMVELLEAGEEQCFDSTDFLVQFYGIKFEDEILQRGLPMREFQRAIGHVVCLSLSVGGLQGAARTVKLDDHPGSGLLVEEEVFARGTRGDLPDLLLGVLDRGRGAKPKHAVVLYLKNVERRTCHRDPRFRSFTDRDFFYWSRLQLFLPGSLGAFRCLFQSQFVGKDLLGDGQRNLGEMDVWLEHCNSPMQQQRR